MATSSARKVRGKVSVADGSDSILQADKRLQWIEARVVSSFRGPLSSFRGPTRPSDMVRKALEDDDIRRDVLHFLDTETARVLFVYPAANGMLRLTTTLSADMNGPTVKKILSLRKEERGKITAENIGVQLAVLEFTPDSAEMLQQLSEEVFAPIIVAGVGSQLSKAVRHALEKEFFAFTQEARAFSGSVSGKALLKMPPDSYDVHEAEMIVSDWLVVLRKVLVEEEEPRRGSFTDPLGAVAPLEECRFWRWRLENLENLVSQLNAPAAKMVEVKLTKSNGKYAESLAAMKARVAQALEDARSIVAWLNPLHRHFESFSPTSQIRTDYTALVSLSVFPTVMHLLHLLWLHNDVYGTVERMGPLMSGICQSVILYSCQHLALDEYFLTNPKEATTRFNAVFEVCTNLKESYFDFKVKILSGNPQKEWRILNETMFRPLDRFLERCNDLVALQESRTIFEWLGAAEVGGEEHNKLHTAIAEVHMDFLEKLNLFAQDSFALLPSMSSEFDNRIQVLKDVISNMQRRIASAIVDYVHGQSISIALVRRMALLQRAFGTPALWPLWQQCLAALWCQWKSEIRTVLQIFNEMSSVGAGGGPIGSSAGIGPVHLPFPSRRLVTCFAALRRLHSLRTAVDSLLAPNPDDITQDYDHCCVLCDTACVKLSDFIAKCFSEWAKDLENVRQLLHRPVIIPAFEISEFGVYFDQKIMSAMRDAATIASLLKKNAAEEVVGALPSDLPAAAEYLLAHRNSLWSNFVAVSECVITFNELHANLNPHDRKLLAEEVKDFELVMQPGTESVMWDDDQVILEFTQNCQRGVATLHSFVQKVGAALSAPLESLNKLDDPPDGALQLPLLISRLGEKTLTAEEFRTRFSLLAQHRVGVVKAVAAEVAALPENALSLINSLKAKAGFPLVTVEHEGWKLFLQYADEKLLSAAKVIALTSLRKILKQVELQVAPGHSTSSEGILPLFDARVEILQDESGLGIMPSMDGDSGLAAALQFCVDGPLDCLKALTTIGEPRRCCVELIETDREIVECKDSIASCVAATKIKVEEFVKKLHPFAELWNHEMIPNLQRCLEVDADAHFFGLPLSNIEARHQAYLQLSEQTQQISSTIVIDWLHIDCRTLKVVLRGNALKCAQLLLDHVFDRISEAISLAEGFISAVSSRMETDLINSADDPLALRRLFETLKKVKRQNSMMASDLKEMTSGIALLTRGNDPAVKEVLQALAERIERLEPSWEALYERTLTVREQLGGLQDREAERVKEGIAEFRQKLLQTTASLFASPVFKRDTAPSEAYALLDSWRSRFDALQQEWFDFTVLQDLYEMTHSEEGTELAQAFEDMQAAKVIWDNISVIEEQRNEWLSTPFSAVDSAVIGEECRQFTRALQGLPNSVKEWECYRGMAAELRDFSVSLPLVHDLRNPSMQQRHWDKLYRVCSAPGWLSRNPSEKSFTLRDLLSIELHLHATEVGRIVERAEKEHGIEMNLMRVISGWQNYCVPVTLSADLDCHILHSIDILFEQLEEHVNVLQALAASRWVDYFRSTVTQWQKDIAAVDATMTQWLDLQKRWQNLYPIFIGSQDMRQQLREEADAFDRVDTEYRALMSRVQPTTKVVDACTVAGSLTAPDTTLLDHIEALQQTISICEKRLAEYLELKRRVFPRFFFLSNTDLVYILSKANDPVKVLHHMGKIVPAIDHCNFDEQGRFCGAVSIEGEELFLSKPCECAGKVENWMHDVMRSIEDSVHQAAHDAYASYSENVRTEWAFGSIVQAILVAARAQWTLETTLALGAVEDGNSSALQDHGAHLQSQLDATIRLVLGTLTPAQRKAVVTLITIDVHCRDIVLQLVQKNVDSPFAFAWLSQLRFFVQPGGASPARFRASICDAEFAYGGEYIGNCGCLVVTPLTDRCYLTLTQALKLHIGGAPAGPAGTGKTETVKDLAHALGIAVYVMNCSDQMDYLTVANIFKGLAMSGSFGCFDEFNRIAIEVLSVVASQVKSIFDALRRSTPTFELFGEQLALRPAVGVFITMNPGYKGRTQLPENIKALFRPCAMVVPDFQYICEITLCAEGFLTAKALANKFVRMYQLNAQLLSPQEHYDWGLRAMRAVLMIAGTLKRKDPQLDERATLMRALQDANEAKLCMSDRSIFRRLLALLFPNISGEFVRDPALEKCIRITASEKGISLGENAIVAQKVGQLYDVLQVRHSAFVMGPPGCGKSTILSLLAGTLDAYTNQRVSIEVINPKALSSDELYGRVHEQTREWKDGILSRVFREFATNPRYAKNHSWILLDSEIDPDWIESMNSVMDDNKLLTLANNERISMSPLMRLIFEISHLHHATPATVSRAGILYINEVDVGWGPIKDRWIAARNERERAHLDILFDKHLLTFVNYSHHSVVPISTVAYVRTLCNFLHGILAREEFADPSTAVFEKLFVWCCIQAFGCSIAYAKGVTDYRSLFSNFVRREFQSLKLPDHGSVFDYCLRRNEEGSDVEWTHWSAALSETEEASPVTPSGVMHADFLVRSSYLLSLFVPHGNPMLFVGTGGVSKTTIVRHYVQHLDPEVYETLEVHFSGFTDSAALQSLLERRLERRTGKQFGPASQKKLVVLLDNINFPLLEQYGSQSALELLRQHVDRGFWLDRTKFAKKYILDVQYVATMDFEAGSQTILDRLNDRLATVSVGLPDQNSLIQLWSSMLAARYHSLKMRDEVLHLVPALATATVKLCEAMVKNFPATGARWNYRFTMRDMRRVIEGLTHITVRTPVSSLARIWAHEAERVFADRLVSTQDWVACRELCVSTAASSFRQILGGPEALSIPAFVMPWCSEDRDVPTRWSLQTDHDEVRATIAEQMQAAGTKTELVLFDQAVEQLARLCRVLAMPNGHCLLIGVGGCGKRSLATLAATLTGHEIYRLQGSTSLNDFKAEMNRMLKTVGLRFHKVCLVVDETHVSHERILEHINEFLCTGTMDLFTSDELDEIRVKICAELRARGDSNFRSAAACLADFRARCAENMRVVYSVSPVGPSLRRLWRMFPGFASVMSIISFYLWPEPALREVATRLFDHQGVHFEDSDERQAVLNHCVAAQQSAERAAELSRSRNQLKMYVTPKSFISYISLYAALLAQKREKWETKHSRLENGLAKLHECGTQVTALQHQLKIRREEAETRAGALEVLLERVGTERGIVAEQNNVAVCEEKKTEKIVAEVNSLVEECESDLKAAEPMIRAAREALDTLNKANLIEMKSMPSPPEEVVSVVAAVMCLMAHGRIPTDRSWQAARRIMQDVPRWMKQLQEYDANNIPQANIDAIQQYLINPGFNPDSIRSKSFAASSLCAWVVNVAKYHQVRVIVRPKELRLEEARRREATSKHQLKKLQARVAELKVTLNAVVAQYDEALENKRATEALIEKLEQKLQRARQLVQSLSGERVRWSEGIKTLGTERGVLVADALLVADFVSYCGSHASTGRSLLLEEFQKAIVGSGLEYTHGLDPADDLFDESTVAQWNNESLPSGAFPSQSASIVLASPRWPLLIDPQHQGLRWMTQHAGGSTTRVIRYGGKKFLRELTDCVSNGMTAIVSNISELDRALYGLLSLGPTSEGASEAERSIVLGDTEVVIHKDFKLIAQTALARPQYRPEVFAQANVVEFGFTEDVLNDQLLGCVVRLENPELEPSLQEIRTAMNGMIIEQRRCEDILLAELGAASGDILENESLVNLLVESKRRSIEVAETYQTAAETRRQIQEARNLYQPVSNRGALMYFCLAELHRIEPMYVYSTDSFLREFKAALEKEKASPSHANRVIGFVNTMTNCIFSFVDRSLLSRHRLAWKAIVTFAVMERNGVIRPDHTAFLVRGSGKTAGFRVPDSLSEWITPQQWELVTALPDVGTALPMLSTLCEDLIDNGRWKQWASTQRPEIERLPGDWKLLSAFHRLLIIRCLRPDRIVAALRILVAETFGPSCLEDQQLPLDAILDHCDAATPILFILTGGADAGKLIDECAEKVGYAGAVMSVSMGQGQEAFAEKSLHTASTEGRWLVIHNIHLMPRWVISLERAVMQLASEDAASCHGDFRLFLSSECVDTLPVVGLLQTSYKVVTESPSDLRATMIRSYSLFGHEPWEQSTKPHEYHCIVFALCFFHALIVGRSRFGPAGWNTKYPFSFEDLRACVDVLSNHLEERPRVPWDDLRFLFGEVMYGGHITDFWDRRVAPAYLQQLVCSESCEGLEIAPGLSNPLTQSFSETLQMLQSTFPEETPSLYGLSQSSETRSSKIQAADLFEQLLLISPHHASVSESDVSSQLEQVAMLMGAVPETLAMDDIDGRFDDEPTPYQHVFLQECVRQNALGAAMRASLDELEAALKGHSPMTAALQDILDDISNDRLPPCWARRCAPTTRPLASWALLLGEGNTQLSNWSLDLMTPKVILMRPLFHPGALLSAILQDAALRLGAELDKVELVTEVTRRSVHQVDVHSREGCFVYGPSLEGAAWDPVANCLQEAKLKGCAPLPVLAIRGASAGKIDRSDKYTCPLYATSNRGSTFIAPLELRTKQPSLTWILKGVAMILDADR